MKPHASFKSDASVSRKGMKFVYDNIYVTRALCTNHRQYSRIKFSCYHTHTHTHTHNTHTHTHTHTHTVLCNLYIKTYVWKVGHFSKCKWITMGWVTRHFLIKFNENNFAWGLVRDDRYDTIHIYLSEQECIPVGCIPPAAVAILGGPHQVPPLEQTPPWDQTPTRDQTPHRDQTPPWDQASTRSRQPPGVDPRTRQPLPPGTGTPPVNRMTDWQVLKT